MVSSNQLWWCALAVAAVTLSAADAEAQTEARSFVGIRSNVMAPVNVIENAIRKDWRESREVSPFQRSTALSTSRLTAPQHTGTRKRSWIRRHPVLLGTLVGFGGGFAIGYMAGDDGIFDDFTAGFNGVVLGAIGAGTGAAVGAAVGATSKP